MNKISSKKKIIIYNFLGFIFSILPPAIAVISYFPIWSERSGTSVFSGFALFLLVICALPLFKFLKKMLSCASIWMFWFLLFIFLYLMKGILNELIVIAFTGFIFGIIGALFFKLAEKNK